jgi:CheY-like chemotaxis protein
MQNTPSGNCHFCRNGEQLAKGLTRRNPVVFKTRPIGIVEKREPMADQAILAVDDEKSILNSLRRSLRKEPYKVFTAESGAEGLEVLAENAIQMVVSDQRMPNMSGTEFLSKVKKLYPDTIRVVLSGYAEAEAIVDSINRGEVYRFIGKPWDEDDLKTIIKQGLAHYNLVIQNRQLSEQTKQQLVELERLNVLLSASVEERTQSLQFSQEVLEHLPLIILGVSQEEELVMTNDTARNQLKSLQGMIPGIDIEEILPPEAVAHIRQCLTSPEIEIFDFQWDDRNLRARPSRLGTNDNPRGCVLLLEDISS